MLMLLKSSSIICLQRTAKTKLYPSQHKVTSRFESAISSATSRSSLRFASTSASVTQNHDPPFSSSGASTAEAQPGHTAAPSYSSTRATFPSQESFDPYLDAPLHIDEHIGYLKELGLDYGWGPTSMIQWLIEHVHIYSGLPWAGTIIATVTLVRLILLKSFLDSSDMSARLQTIKPLTDPLFKKMVQARAKNDRAASIEANAERLAINRKHGIKFWKMCVPLIQLPLGFGTFRLLRGMGDLPVPGFDTGGALWFQDLTMPDPYGILILSTSVMYYVSFKVYSYSRSWRFGLLLTDDAMKQAMAGDGALSPALQSIFRWVIPTFTGVIGLFLPATAVFTVAQTRFFRSPSFRALLRMHPFPPKPAVSSQPPLTIKPNIRGKPGSVQEEQKPKFGLEAMKATFAEAFADLKKKQAEMGGTDTSRQSRVNDRRTSAEAKRAKQYEEKVQRERAQRRFETSQRKR